MKKPIRPLAIAILASFGTVLILGFFIVGPIVHALNPPPMTRTYTPLPGHVSGSTLIGVLILFAGMFVGGVIDGRRFVIAASLLNLVLAGVLTYLHTSIGFYPPDALNYLQVPLAVGTAAVGAWAGFRLREHPAIRGFDQRVLGRTTGSEDRHIPLDRVLVGTFLIPIGYPLAFAKSLAIPALLLFAAVEAWYRLPSDKLYWVIDWFWLIPFTMVAVRTHRIAILGFDHVGQGLRAYWSRDHTYFLLTLLAFAAIPWIVGYTLKGRDNSLSGTELLVYFAAFYALARVSPLLPALAIGDRPSALKLWSSTRGNGWRLVAIVWLLPMFLSYLLKSSDWDAGWLGTLLSALYIVVLVVEVLALSLCYRALSGSFRLGEPRLASSSALLTWFMTGLGLIVVVWLANSLWTNVTSVTYSSRSIDISELSPGRLLESEGVAVYRRTAAQIGRVEASVTHSAAELTPIDDALWPEGASQSFRSASSEYFVFELVRNSKGKILLFLEKNSYLRCDDFVSFEGLVPHSEERRFLDGFRCPTEYGPYFFDVAGRASNSEVWPLRVVPHIVRGQQIEIYPVHATQTGRQ